LLCSNQDSNIALAALPCCCCCCCYRIPVFALTVQHNAPAADLNPIPRSTLAELLQLACFAASAPCLLAYCDLKPEAKEAAAAAAAARKKHSSSRSSTPAPNGVYPDPDLVSDDDGDETGGLGFSTPLTSPTGKAAAAAAAAAGENGDAFEECISGSSSSSTFVSPTASCELAAAADDSSLERSSSAQAAAVAAVLEAAAADITRAPGGTAATAAADAAAAAAAAQWSGSPLHLSMLVALGPLFAEEQQGPCLVRLMELLVQYYSDTNAAAQQLSSVLKQQVQQQHRSSSSSSSYSQRYSSSRSAAAAAAADLPGSSRLLVLLMGLYHLEMWRQQQQQRQQQQWLMQQQQRAGARSKSTQAGSSSSSSSSSSSVYDDQAIRLAACAAAAHHVAQLTDLLWYCTMQPAATAGLSSSSSSKRVCPVAAELLHAHINLQQKFVPEDCTLLSKAPEDVRHHFLLGIGFADPTRQPEFISDWDCWKALSQTCDGCGSFNSSTTALNLCATCECAVLCAKCRASAAHSPQACSALADLQETLVSCNEAMGRDLCRCDMCINKRRQSLVALEMRPRFSPLQQLLVPWQHWLPPPQQQQRVRPSPGWLPFQQQQQQQRDETAANSKPLLLPVTVLSAEQARDLSRSPVAVCKDAEKQRCWQYRATWAAHMQHLSVQGFEALAENQEVRRKEQQRLEKERQKGSSGGSSKAAGAAAAAAGGWSGPAAAGAANLYYAASAGLFGAMGMGRRQQQQQGAGARFGAKPYQGVGLSDDKLFGLD
jgi:hypothetical protein